MTMNVGRKHSVYRSQSFVEVFTVSQISPISKQLSSHVSWSSVASMFTEGARYLSVGSMSSSAATVEHRCGNSRRVRRIRRQSVCLWLIHRGLRHRGIACCARRDETIEAIIKN